MTENLISSVHAEINRINARVLPAYRDIGPVGTFGATMIQASINHAKQAIASGDVQDIMASLIDLKEINA